MEQYEMDNATKEKFNRRGLTIRMHSVGHEILREASFLERRSMSAITRECLGEYFRLRYNWNFPPLTDLSIDE